MAYSERTARTGAQARTWPGSCLSPSLQCSKGTDHPEHSQCNKNITSQGRSAATFDSLLEHNRDSARRHSTSFGLKSSRTRLARSRRPSPPPPAEIVFGYASFIAHTRISRLFRIRTVTFGVRRAASRGSPRGRPLLLRGLLPGGRGTCDCHTRPQ